MSWQGDRRTSDRSPPLVVSCRREIGVGEVVPACQALFLICKHAGLMSRAGKKALDAREADNTSTNKFSFKPEEADVTIINGSLPAGSSVAEFSSKPTPNRSPVNTRRLWTNTEPKPQHGRNSNRLCLTKPSAVFFWLLLQFLWKAMLVVASGNDCLNNIVLFNVCPPSRRFQPHGRPSLLGDFRDPKGVTLDWHCGHTSGLKLRQQSQTLVSNLTARLDQGFSLSLWFQPGNTSLLRLQSIVSISKLEEEIDIAGCSQDLLRIGQYGAFLLLRYRDAFETCKVRLLHSTKLQESKLVKLLFTTDESQSRTFSDGVLIDQSTGIRVHTTTQHEARQVRLFGSADGADDAFRGAIYQFSLDNRTLSNDRVRQMNDTTCYDEISALPAFDLNATAPSALLVLQGSSEPRGISIPWPESPGIAGSITAIPEQGRVYLDGIEAGVGAVFHISTKLKYTTTHPAFFNSPHIDVHGVDRGLPNESLAYRFLAFDDDGYLVAQSSVIQLAIRVLLVNHLPTLHGPEQVIPSDNGDAALDVIGIKLVDTDFDMNLVRIDIECQRGRITVSSAEARAHLQSFPCIGRTASPWQCMGDGLDDRRIIAVASPTDIGRALDRLTYKTLVAGRPEADNVTVTVFDGEGGDCLTLDEHWDYQSAVGNSYPSVHPAGCMSVQTIVPIVWDSGDPDVQPNPTRRQRDGRIPDILFWALCIVFFLYTCRARLRKCALRGTAVDADNSDDTVSHEPRVQDTSPRNPPSDSSVGSSVYWDEISLP